MLALSTSFKSNDAKNGAVLVQALESFDIGGIELEYRITDKLFFEMEPALRRSELTVVSVHNFFPFPTGLRAVQKGGDMFRLSDPDKEERNRAVAWTVKTIEHANALEAQAVVLHCGFVAMAADIDRLHHFFLEDAISSDAAQDFIAQKLEERGRLLPRYLDALLFSLDRLLPAAEKHGVQLALENRFHYNELPGPKDFRGIFNEFKGAPLGYWHDMGHAHANECLTLLEPDALLKENAGQLIGIHLHDAKGLNDHLAPGKGEIDFNRIKPFLKPDTRLVLELKPGTGKDDVAAGIRYLAEKKIGIENESKGENYDESNI